MGKSSDLHAGVEQFKSHSGHKFAYILSGSYSQPYFGQFFYLVYRYLEKKYLNNIMFKTVGSISSLDFTRTHVARDLTRKKYFGIFYFRFRF